MRRAWPITLAAALALSGCGASASVQIQAKLQQFAHAVAQHDAHTLCGEVLAPRLISRLNAAGLTCDEAMTTFVQSVSSPTLSVSKVTVHGSTASAVVLATAHGQAADIESVQLVNTAGGWRLMSLASPR
jgi:hypothetical protein